MKIYTRFDESRPGVVRLWVRSWQARGWTPRLLVGDETTDGIEVSLSWINFGFKNPRSKPTGFPGAVFGHAGWKDAPIVYFHTASEEDILNCGRALCL